MTLEYKKKDLLPGEIIIGYTPILVRASVDSSILVCLYSAADRVGAIAHPLLPHPDRLESDQDSRFVGRAIPVMLEGLRKLGIPAYMLQAKLIYSINEHEGGRINFPYHDEGVVEHVKTILRSAGIGYVSEWVEGGIGSKVVFDSMTGLLTANRLVRVLALAS